jgi:hypothetical protein
LQVGFVEWAELVGGDFLSTGTRVR